MKNKIFSLLGVEQGEEFMVSLFLIQSVFIGIFFGAFDISAHSLFLSVFDEKMMARGYVVSGFAGIILTSLYTWLQTRMKFKNFAILNLLLVTSMTLLLWIALMVSASGVVIFVVFIMFGPLNILAMLGFWGTTGRLFSLRQGKRLFGLVDVGLIIGTILSCYTIPVLLSFSFKSHNILLISSSAILAAAFIQIIIGSKFGAVLSKGEQMTTKEENNEKEEKKSVISVLKADPYARIMAVFIALSVVTAFFVQYSFMAVTREQYPAEADMARFLGIFTGSMMIFTLLVKLLAFSYLIRNYGLKTCLAISPILVAAFTIFAILIGLFMGYTPESASGFIIFFLLLALSRLFSKSLKDSIESPSFKVIYQTIDEKVRYEIQSGMDGTVNEIAALSSGLILAGLGVLSFIKLIHFSLVLLVIIIVWIFFAFKLYNEYRKSIRKALESVGEVAVSSESPTRMILNNRFSAALEFKSDYFCLIKGDSSVPDKNKSNWYFKNIVRYASEKNDFNLIPVIKKISSWKLANESDAVIQKLETFYRSDVHINEKVLSAKKMLLGERVPQTAEILRLLRDNSLESKRSGIFLIGKFNLRELLPEVCECLNVPGLEIDAASVLASFGKSAREEIERFYLASSGNINISRTILRLLGNINSSERNDFLFARLWSNSRQLKEIALKYLVEAEYRADGENVDKLNQYISELIELSTWNLSAKICLQRNNDAIVLEALNKEIARWTRFLFNVLSITYDSGSIRKIRENLESDTVESVNYALEMIDIVIDESIKPKIISLVDMVPDEIKIRNLYQFFPGDIPQYNRLMEDLINRDYNLINIWTKACALRAIKKIEDDSMKDTVIALLFSPEIILQEEIARLLARSYRELYKSVSNRIPSSVKIRVDKIFDGKITEAEFLFEKVEFLSRCFSEIQEEELITLASALIYCDSNKQFTDFSGGSIIWHLNSENEISEIDVISDIKEISDRGVLSGTNGTYIYLLPLNAVEQYHFQFPDKSLVILKYIEKYEVQSV
jgi:ATP:ADP antiporter, AAA family